MNVTEAKPRGRRRRAATVPPDAVALMPSTDDHLDLETTGDARRLLRLCGKLQRLDAMLNADRCPCQMERNDLRATIAKALGSEWNRLQPRPAVQRSDSQTNELRLNLAMERIRSRLPEFSIRAKLETLLLNLNDLALPLRVDALDILTESAESLGVHLDLSNPPASDHFGSTDKRSWLQNKANELLDVCEQRIGETRDASDGE